LNTTVGGQPNALFADDDRRSDSGRGGVGAAGGGWAIGLSLAALLVAIGALGVALRRKPIPST